MIQLSIRQLLAHKARFFMTSFAVVLGVSFVVGALVVSDTVRRDFNTLFTELDDGIDFRVRSVSGLTDDAGDTSRAPLPDQLVGKIAGVDGVAAEGRVSGFAQLIPPDGDRVTATAGRMIGTSYGGGEDIYPFAVASGHRPTDAGQVAIDQRTFDEHDLQLGQSVEIVLASGTGTYELVGTVRFGENASPGGTRLTLFTLAEAQRVFAHPDHVDVIDIAVAPHNDPEQVLAEISSILPPGAEVVSGQVIADENADAAGETSNLLGNVLVGFAAVALFVSGFYIYNTFAIVVGQRTRELALLRAIGAKPSQIRRAVVLEAAFIGIVSSAAGFGLGVIAAVGITRLLNANGFTLPGDTLVVDPRTVVSAGVVGVGVTLVASLLPARRAARVSPVAALRDGAGMVSGSPRVRLGIGATMTSLGAAGVTYGLAAADEVSPTLLGLGGGAVCVFLGIANLCPLFAGPATRLLGAPVARLLGEPGRLARANASRNPLRTATTASALVIGLALITMATIAGTSLKESFADTLDSAVTADIVISGFEGISPALAEELGDRPEFDAVAAVRFGQFRFDDGTKGIAAIGSQADRLVDIDLIAGGPLAELGPDEIIVHDDPASGLGLDIGDQVPVAFGSTGEQVFTVAGIHRDATFVGNYVVSLETWNIHFADDVDHGILIKSAEGITIEDAEAIVNTAAEPFRQVDVENRQEFLATQEAQVDQVLVVVNVLLLVAVIIAVLGISNTLALSVFERTRELGLLRAVGLTRRQTRRMIRWESAIISLFGAILGVVIGIGFGAATATAMPDSLVNRISIPTNTLIGLIALALVAGLLAAILPARRAAKLNVLDAITAQ